MTDPARRCDRDLLLDQAPEEAVELYLFHNDPTKVDLFSSGLWMPLEKKYYTDQADIDFWTKNDVHPPEYRTAVDRLHAQQLGRRPSTRG